MQYDTYETIYENWVDARRRERALPPYQEPTIENIYRENGNFTVVIKGEPYTYSEAELKRNFPRQYGGR